ncbi:hypothetical protein O181_127836 [Austropuccinia psidii MF-1]|uniref:Uncharacterized protein n=1 Tax=Austropuccinia psidii MF-1 TaxID=1389203 RepID=A0A9Q3KWZ4_9BASI|nr:hypothetical protein [Austropuccinia psidii MF-1]
MTPALEKEVQVASTSSKPAPEMSKDKPKGPQKKQKGPKNLSKPWRQAGHYQSLKIEDLPTPNQPGGFMEDPPSTVSNLDTAQYRQNQNTGFTKYRPALNTGLHLRCRFLQYTVMGSQNSNFRLAISHIYQLPFTHCGNSSCVG